MTDGNQAIVAFTVWILPILFAVTLHEAAHGYVARLCGDRTAWLLGRVSINPLKHVDPVGTVLFPAFCLLFGGFLFGWAKPVPVNFRALRRPRLDMILVALAGPGTNIVLAVLSMLLLYAVPYLPGSARHWASLNLVNSIDINLVLAVFNMLPVPPLDGGRVLVGLLPRQFARPVARFEDKGILVILLVLVLLPLIGTRLGVNLDIARPLILGPADWLRENLAALLGFS